MISQYSQNSKRHNQQKDLNDSNSLNLDRDVKQMQSLFREIKNSDPEQNQQYVNRDQSQTLKKNNFTQAEVENLQRIPQNNYQDQNFQGLYEQQQSKIAALENHIIKTNKTNELLYKKLNDQEEQIQENNKSLKRLHGEKSWKSNQVEDLNYRFHDVAQTHNEFLKNARNHSETLLKEIEFKDKELKKLRNALDDQSNKLSVVTVTQEKNMDSCLDLDRRLKQFQDENKELKKQLQEQKQQNDILSLNKKAEGTFLVEVEHLRSDVKRLVQMLKSTSEFQEFGELAEDSGQIRFLKGVKAKSYVDYGAACKCKVKKGQETEAVDERNLWCPEEAWKFAHDFRLKYDGELTETLIERLLFEFSKIWSRREQRMIQRVKANCAAEASGLRRQLAHNPKYDEHQAKATIARLKKQLKDAYRENREIHAERYERNPPGIKWVSETVKMARNTNKAVKKAQEQNRILREKLQDMEKLKFQDNSEKTLFMEGAAWVSRTLQKESDILQKQWKQLTQQQQNNINDDNIREMDQMVHKFHSKVTSFKSNCQKEMLLAESQLAKINRPASSTGVVRLDEF